MEFLELGEVRGYTGMESGVLGNTGIKAFLWNFVFTRIVTYTLIRNIQATFHLSPRKHDIRECRPSSTAFCCNLPTLRLLGWKPRYLGILCRDKQHNTQSQKKLDGHRCWTFTTENSLRLVEDVP